MSQKKCPQCKNLISVKAPTCLYCGRPNKFVTKDYINKKWKIDNNTNSFYSVFITKQSFIILSFLLIIIILLNIFK